MRWIFLIVGLLIGAAGGFVGNSYRERQRHTQGDSEIVFAAKNFYDSGPNASYQMLVTSGTLTGPDLAYPNNTRAISCMKQESICVVSSVEQIGRNQIGRLDGPWPYTVTKWDQQEIVAGDEANDINCSKLTITIERKSETVFWVEEPINQTRPMCKNSDPNIRKYTLEDSPAWKKIFGKKD
jgi:hypothetical protein